ncbi:MAG: glycosyl transferase [Candidatus Binatia bacterium]|nr:MAG: glycosyl transferase [Candidatus Binatia bacterium]
MSAPVVRARPLSGGAILSNGTFRTLFSRRGTGTAWARSGKDWLQAYGWKPDVAEDHLGWLFYVRDGSSGASWSLTPAPRPNAKARYRFRRTLGVAGIRCWLPELTTELAAWVSDSAPLEFRSLCLENRSGRHLELEVTTYLEVVLFPFEAFAAHPAFAKLFVQTHWSAEHRYLGARRRPRSTEERWPILFLAALNADELEYESDRLRFLGRGRDCRNAAALSPDGVLSGTVGNVLDPVMCLRTKLALAPGERTELGFVCGFAAEEGDIAQMVQELRNESLESLRREAARWHRQQLEKAGLRLPEARFAEELATAWLYRSPQLRPDSELAKLPGNVARLPAQLGLADDIRTWLLVHVEEENRPWDAIARYWASTGVPGDLVLVEESRGDVQVMRGTDPAKRVSLARAEYAALLACAGGRWPAESSPGYRRVALRRTAVEVGERTEPAGMTSRLDHWNGYGGFGAGGQEYVIRLAPGHVPPMPWVNVMANPEFGSLVSERGGGFTWSRNSREYRLTEWSNDPVTDPPSECLYVRDEVTGAFRSLMPAPCGAGVFEVTHGRGFTRWHNRSDEIESVVTWFVPPDMGVRVIAVELTNLGQRDRRLSLWHYARLILGADPWRVDRQVTTELEPQTGILWARNRAMPLFERRVVFATLGAEGAWQSQVAAGDRVWFLGVGGSVAAPEALRRSRLEHGPFGAGHDAAAVVAGAFFLGAGRSWRGWALLGEAEDQAQGRAWVEGLASWDRVMSRLEATKRFWEARSSALVVHTPWPELDVLCNHWLLYQTTSCRLWGRSAFYQSGGAVGFRDQLQDACALLWSHPEETRAQILLHAAHQFPEGDVLHWWHPPWEKGTRTRFSDDLLWLPLTTAWYVAFTGDYRLLDEPVPFVRARALEPSEDEAYLSVERTPEATSLYEHCCRALERSLTKGPHGLPLMGTGDWNDGMNRVGRQGRGESVWLGFFLAEVLAQFIPLCEARGDSPRASRFRDFRVQLVSALEAQGWDGAWYLRAYFDDGTPLGSAASSECQIDALVQAWAVLSGVAARERALRALQAVEERLVDRESKIIRLLAPPFDRMPKDPGYIKGYVPGIRENGGQYTHAAIWVVQAFFHAGLRERARELLRCLLPLEHARDAAAAQIYKVEPYVVAADIYGEPPHRGRGGWTWYTGSAGWLYRLVIETILGIRLRDGEVLEVSPRIPDSWPHCSAVWKVPRVNDVYRIRIERSGSDTPPPVRAWLDGQPLPVEGSGVRIPLVRDGRQHEVKIVLAGSGSLESAS